MFFQPLVFFTAIMWALGFAAFGFYVAFKRGAAPIGERMVDLVASLLVGALGAGVMIGGLYIIEELI
jgi:putative copper export protein